MNQTMEGSLNYVTGHSTVGSDQTITLTGGVGTSKYTAPEVLDGNGDRDGTRSRYSTKADIYS